MKMAIHQGWIASLSDGSQRFEPATRVAGAKSAWQQLLDELDKTGLELRGLYLQRGSLRVYALPHKECNGYMQAYEVQKAFWRGTGFQEKEQRLYQGIGAIVGDQVFLTWINLDNLNVHQDIRPLSSCKMHTTLREVSNDRPSDERGSG